MWVQQEENPQRLLLTVPFVIKFWFGAWLWHIWHADICWLAFLGESINALSVWILGFIMASTSFNLLAYFSYRREIISSAGWIAFEHFSVFTATVNSAHLFPSGRVKNIIPEELANHFHKLKNFHNFGVVVIPKLNYALSFSICKIGVIVWTVILFINNYNTEERALDWELRGLSSIPCYDWLHGPWANYFNSVSSPPKWEF